VGFVSDETLAQLYDHVDAAIAPLRFGAGVKGKVLEALHVGTPIIVTSVAAQGIPDIRDVCSVADTAEAFAEAVCVLLTSRSLRVSTSRDGQDLIRRHFSIDAVRDVLSRDIPEIRPPDGSARAPAP
jgi:glycosyltransferase involved in cell wall biosynthesis